MNILLIEPDPKLAQLLQSYFHDYQVRVALDGHQAVKHLEQHPFDIIVSEHTFHGHNSFEFLYELRSYPEWQDLPFILFTSTYLSDAVLQSDAYKQLKISAYLYKPKSSFLELQSAMNHFQNSHAKS